MRELITDENGKVWVQTKTTLFGRTFYDRIEADEAEIQAAAAAEGADQ